MRWVIAGVIVLIAGCGGGGEVAERVDPAPYLAAALTPADVKGSEARGGPVAAAEELRRCLGVAATASTATAIDTDHYLIEHVVDVFESTSKARSMLRRFEDSKRVASCVATHLKPRILAGVAAGDGDTARVTIGRELMTRHPSPKIGDRSMSMRVSIPINEEGWNASMYYFADVVAAQKGPAVVMLVAVNAPTADRFTLEGYVRTVVGRQPR